MPITITFDKNTLPHVVYDIEGRKREFEMEFIDVLNLIANAVQDKELGTADGANEVEEEKVKVISPSLPSNTVKYAGIGEEGDRHLLFLDFKAFVSEAAYHSTTFDAIPFPNMVFAFEVMGKKLINVHMAIYKDMFIRDTTVLYKWPFSNVWGSDGHLCYWEHVDIKDLVQLQTFAFNWVRVPNNDHYFHQESSTNLKLPMRELFERLDGKEEFEYDMLNAMTTGIEPLTFGRWSQNIFDNIR